MDSIDASMCCQKVCRSWDLGHASTRAWRMPLTWTYWFPEAFMWMSFLTISSALQNQFHDFPRFFKIFKFMFADSISGKLWGQISTWTQELDFRIMFQSKHGLRRTSIISWILDVWRVVQSEPGAFDPSWWLTKFDFLRSIWPELGVCEASNRTAAIDLWSKLLEEFAEDNSSIKPPILDLWKPMQRKLWEYFPSPWSSMPFFGVPIQSEAAKDQRSKAQNLDCWWSFQWNSGRSSNCSGESVPGALTWKICSCWCKKRGLEVAPLGIISQCYWNRMKNWTTTFWIWIFVQRPRTLGYRFNRKIHSTCLPETLKRLCFGFSFNQDLKEIRFPTALQDLTLGGVFNSPLKGRVFPDSLRSLTFGCRFNQTLALLEFPESLHTLTFGEDFDQSLEGVNLPKSLQSLRFGGCFNQPLQNLSFPNSLEYIKFGHFFNQNLEKVIFPTNLKSLEFGDFFNQKLDIWISPLNLHTLTFGQFFNQSLEEVTLPSSLERISFGKVFNRSLERVTWLVSWEKKRRYLVSEESLADVKYCNIVYSCWDQTWVWVTMTSHIENFGMSDSDMASSVLGMLMIPHDVIIEMLR